MVGEGEETYRLSPPFCLIAMELVESSRCARGGAEVESAMGPGSSGWLTWVLRSECVYDDISKQLRERVRKEDPGRGGISGVVGDYLIMRIMVFVVACWSCRGVAGVLMDMC